MKICEKPEHTVIKGFDRFLSSSLKPAKSSYNVTRDFNRDIPFRQRDVTCY